MSDTTPARVGGPARGYSWAPFEKGNTAAMRHGAFSRYALAEADALVPTILDAAPHLGEADEFVVRDYAVAQVRVWRLAAAVEAEGELVDGRPHPALKSLREWMGTADRLRSRLGLDPTSRAALAVDETLARRQAAALARDQADEGRRLREQAAAAGYLNAEEDDEDGE